MHATQNPVTDPVTPGRTLRHAALYLTRHGWIQGAYYDQTATVFTPAACAVGAIGMVCYGGPVDAPALNFEDEAWPDFNEAVEYLEDYLSDTYPGDVDVYEFNDVKGQTADRVVAAVSAAALEWDRTHGGAA
jgi:hypothetical protein